MALKQNGVPPKQIRLRASIKELNPQPLQLKKSQTVSSRYKLLLHVRAAPVTSLMKLP